MSQLRFVIESCKSQVLPQRLADLAADAVHSSMMVALASPDLTMWGDALSLWRAMKDNMAMLGSVGVEKTQDLLGRTSAFIEMGTIVSKWVSTVHAFDQNTEDMYAALTTVLESFNPIFRRTWAAEGCTHEMDKSLIDLLSNRVIPNVMLDMKDIISTARARFLDHVVRAVHYVEQVAGGGPEGKHWTESKPADLDLKVHFEATLGCTDTQQISRLVRGLEQVCMCVCACSVDFC
jgi:hypothetical protein